VSSAAATFARGEPVRPQARALGNLSGARLVGGDPLEGRSYRDTIIAYGGPGVLEGKFETELNEPDRQDWTGVDLTVLPVVDPNWNISQYNCANLDTQTPDNHAWWCGEDLPACNPDDVDGGYGNDYYETLAWSGTVPDPSDGVTVHVSGMLNYDTEDGYDFLELVYFGASGPTTLLSFDGDDAGVAVNEYFSVNPYDFTGQNLDQIEVRWRFVSDHAWSDEDCWWWTAGAAQIDLLTVRFNQGQGWEQIGTVETCEPGDDVQWVPLEGGIGVGDFSQVWLELDDIVECLGNGTPQFGFIDDGEIVPGTGGSDCETWCYGPGGYVVNTRGGLLGRPYGVDNEIWSPPIAWPGSDYDGALLSFDIYTHTADEYPFIYYKWNVRSTTDPAGETGWSEWQNDLLYTGGAPNYQRVTWDITSDLEPGVTFVQIALGVTDLGGPHGWLDHDATPAPYFDNVALRAFQITGPAVTAEDVDLAQDNFPDGGSIDYQDLGNNSVRFDMARNIAAPLQAQIVPGDSVVIDVVPIRPGSVIQTAPQLHYKLQPNPLFDDYRLGVPDEGSVNGLQIPVGPGNPDGTRWSFDLPDVGFLFPGDRLHYFFQATDFDGETIGTTMLPADTTGFSGFDNWLIYPAAFTMRALPSLQTATQGDHPKVLFWDDGTPEERNEWYFALQNTLGADYDMYVTNGPDAGVGNGLAGRATVTQIKEYEVILYRCGDLDRYTLGNGDFGAEASNDIILLETWLVRGDKGLLLSGDNLLTSLQNSGSLGTFFLLSWIRASVVGDHVTDLIDDQISPTVLSLDGNPVFSFPATWKLAGSCPHPRRFDAMTPIGLGVTLAEFGDPNDLGGAYPYTAALLGPLTGYNSDIITLPYDLAAVHGLGAPVGDKATVVPARHVMLAEILNYFGQTTIDPVDVPAVPAHLQATAYPNPFNPRTTIEYAMPQAGELQIRIYDLRGGLVQTVLDEQVAAGTGTVVWDGTDRRAQIVAAGAYFYEVRAPHDTVVGKLMLIK